MINHDNNDTNDKNQNGVNIVESSLYLQSRIFVAIILYAI